MMLLVSCNNDEPPITPPQEETTPRTVLIYMVANNNLSSYSVSDLGEITQAVQWGHLGKSRLIIYYARKNAAELLEMTADGTNVIKTYSNDLMSVNASRMTEVINDAKAFAPADTYGMIFWGHGSGYLQNGIDESNITPLSYGGENINGTNYWMNITTLSSVLSGKGFDWIYFDCCFMAGIEVAYELRHVTNTIVASATEIPADGMPYHSTLQYLMPKNSDLDAAAKATFDFYDQETGMYRTCTMSVIHTDAIDEIASAMKAIYATRPTIPRDYVPQPFQTSSDQRRYDWHYYDFKHYAMALANNNNTLTINLNTAFEHAISTSLATPMLWNDVKLLNHCGLSTLIIESADDPFVEQFGYNQLSWWKDIVATRFK